MKKSIIFISLFLVAYTGVKNPRDSFKKKVKSPVYIVPSSQNHNSNGQIQNQQGVKYLDPFMFMQKNNHTQSQTSSVQQNQNNNQGYHQYGTQGKIQQINQPQIQYTPQQNLSSQPSNTLHQTASQFYPLQTTIISPMTQQNQQLTNSGVNNNRTDYNTTQKISGITTVLQGNTLQPIEYQSTGTHTNQLFYTPVQ